MQGIFHTGITVSDLDRSIPFYRDVLGLKLVTGPTDVFEGDDLSRALGVRGARLRLAVFQVGDGSLEVLQYFSPKSAVDKPMPPNTLGVAHVAFRVSNAKEKMKELKAKGVKFLSELNVEEEGPLAGWKWVYFKDPDGISLELIEYNPPL
jgi:catechol 2,3-dioxygenase-like lactoylglutathione lyase family enzyme